jgi:acetyl-CoA acetyltransferase
MTEAEGCQLFDEKGAVVRKAVICEPLRTPVGRYGGMFRDVAATELAARVIRELISRSALGPDLIDDVLLGQCYPNGEPRRSAASPRSTLACR